LIYAYIESLLYSYLILVELDRLTCARGFTSHIEEIFHLKILLCIVPLIFCYYYYCYYWNYCIFNL